MNRLIALAALALIATPAAAAPAARAPATTVRHADLDLANAGDAKVMLTRIRRAAASVCLDSPGGGDSSAASVQAFEVCHRAAVSRAVADLAAPRVTEALNATAPAQVLARLP